MQDTLYIIDGHAHIYRAFYAVEGLNAPDGRPTGATMGFTRMLLQLLKHRQPAYVTAVFDAPGKNFRHKMYDKYKANRKPTPPELIAQVPLIQEIVKAYRIPIFTVPGYEADDLIGTLTRQAETRGLKVTIVTGDKDCGQLLNENVSIYDAQKETFTTAAAFEEKKGIAPALLVDVMGLWGDSADNIPGVPGIGEKIGVQLLREYGSLEALLARAGEIKGKRGEVIREHAEQARLSRELARIRLDAPVELDVEAARLKDPDTTKLRKIFEELGFKSLLRQLEPDAAPAPEKRDYVLVDTPEKFASFLAALRHEPLFAFDLETTGLDPLQNRIVGMSFSWSPRAAYYLPFLAPAGTPTLSPKEFAETAKILADPARGKTGQNLKFDALALRHAGARLEGVKFDTLLASSLLHGHLVEHGLDALSLRYLDLKKIPTTDIIGTGKAQITMAEAPVEKVCEYACEDADAAFRLYQIFSRDLAADAATQELFEKLELPLMGVLEEMQFHGIRVDADILARQSAELSGILEALTSEIHALAGKEFNIASPKQLGEILFGDLGLPALRQTKTGPSTDEETLSELAALGHELPERVLQYRTYSKLKNTYLDALPKLVNPATGRIHTTFSQTATATGRLSSRDPNLQNIPVRTERGRAIRAAFVPETGWKLLAADYSQVELRMLAHFSGDATLRRAFETERDIHRVVAAELNGIPEEEVTPEQRGAAKTVNFGIIYGQSAHGLSRTTGMGLGEAKLFIDSYFEQFPRVLEFINEVCLRARREGGVTTMLGRRRRIPELESSNKMKLARGEREALNTLIQGSAADLVKTAMVNLRARMAAETPRSRMLLQIHDELVFETPPEEAELLAEIVREEMEHALPLAVPLRVDMGLGDNWLEVK